MIAAASIATGTSAQSSRPANPPTDQDRASQSPPSDILRGPEVREDQAGPAAQMGQTMTVRPGAITVPAPRWMELYRELTLEPAQQRAARVAEAEFQQSIRAYRDEHAEEIQALQQQTQAARRRQEPPDPAIERRFAELRANAPQQTQLQERLWDILTDDQQDALRMQLAEERNAMAELRLAAQRERMGGGDDAMSMDAMMRLMRASGELTLPPGVVIPEVVQQRIAFLQRHQSRTLRGPLPLDADMRFRFDDDDDGRQPRSRD